METNKSMIIKNNFYLPGEWYKHKRTFIIWPSFSKKAKLSYVFVAKKIALFEEVYLGVPEVEMELARKYVNDFPNIKIVNIESNDGWVRDSGPFFLINNYTYASILWQYNFSGKNKFNSTKDNRIGTSIIKIIRSKINFRPNMILEGGSITCDGEGTIITTKSVLLNKNRNNKLTKKEIENYLLGYLNCKKIIWLKKGLTSDKDTGGHVDNICRFIAPTKVLLGWDGSKNSKDAYRILFSALDARGRKLEIILIPFPKKMYLTEKEYMNMSIPYKKIRKIGQELAGSYINHYVFNGAVICPSFDKETTKKARKILQKCYLNRKIIMVPYKISRNILIGGGNIHCITLQQYA